MQARKFCKESDYEKVHNFFIMGSIPIDFGTGRSGL